MDTLPNVETRRGEYNPLTPDLPPTFPPEKQNNPTGVSVRYAPDPSKKWFVLRVTYNRANKANDFLQKCDVDTYLPMRWVWKLVRGKKKRILEPLIPNLLFAYASQDVLDSCMKAISTLPCLSYYYDHFNTLPGGKNPPLTVGYQDMMRLEFFTDKFKYEWTNLFFETKYYPTEAAGTEEDSIRMLMAHRLEFRPLSWLSFAISENVMYHAKTLNLKYLNPAFIFHNLNDRTMFNAIAYGEISILPFAGWEIYGQFVLDQARAPNESDRQSDAWGVLAGTRSTHSLWGGYIEPSLEFAYTTPLLYRRDGLDFLMYQRSFTYDGGSPIKLYYIGFPYGGDVMMLHFALDWVLPGKAEASLSFDGILKGEMNMLKSHNKDGDNSGDANYSGITPSGNEMMRIFILSLYGKYSFPELWNFANVSIWSELSFVGSDIYKKDSGTASDGRFDVQFVLGFSIGI